MHKLPGHCVVRRATNQSDLVISNQDPQGLSDSGIVIKMLSAAVCGTDLAILSGARPDCAEVLGHEGVGMVVNAPECSGLLIGDRVIINPVHRKQPEIVVGHSRDGIFRDLFCMDSADAAQGKFLVRCPSDCSLPNTELVLAEPLGSVLYSMELLREQCATASLLIRGSGTVGIMAAKLWATMTGSFALLVSQSEKHAQWLRNSTSWPASVRICCSAQLHEACSSVPAFKAAILCCSRESAPEGLGSLLDVVPEGATIDLMAGFPTQYWEVRLGGVSIDSIRWNNICGKSGAPPTPVVDRSNGKTVYLIGHRGTAQRHILQAIEILSGRIISLADIPHRLFTLEQLPGVVKAMLPPSDRHNTKWVKAIVDFSRKTSGEPSGYC